MTGAAFVVAAILHLAGKKFGVRLASDDFDIRVYFASARWVIEGGRLYREVGSEYPLFANIIFATLRFLAYLLHPGFYAFKGLWVASAWLVYLWYVYRFVKDIGIFVALAWLAPAPIYFALFRFDLYPAVATLMFLFAIRRTAHIEAAIWLGVAIALKGYALFMLPTYCEKRNVIPIGVELFGREVQRRHSWYREPSSRTSQLRGGECYRRP